MSKNRNPRRILKTPLRHVLIRIAKMGRRLAKLGRNPAHAARVLKESGSMVDRARWRRWYRANKKHQRRFAAARRGGGNVAGIPHSLSIWMVP